MSEIEYRLHWARTHLKAIGAVENSARGVWAITDKGQAISQEEMHAATKEWRARIRARRLANRAAEGDEVPDEPEVSSWKDQLVARTLELPPAGFERLAQRLLREAGFVNVTVTGKSGDGGRRCGHLPAIAGVVPRVLPVQAVPGNRHRRRRTRLPGGHGGPWREGPPHHHRFLHQGRAERSEPGWGPAGRADRRVNASATS